VEVTNPITSSVVDVIVDVPTTITPGTQPSSCESFSGITITDASGATQIEYSLKDPELGLSSSFTVNDITGLVPDPLAQCHLMTPPRQLEMALSTGSTCDPALYTLDLPSHKVTV